MMMHPFLCCFALVCVITIQKKKKTKSILLKLTVTWLTLMRRILLLFILNKMSPRPGIYTCFQVCVGVHVLRDDCFTLHGCGHRCGQYRTMWLRLYTLTVQLSSFSESAHRRLRFLFMADSDWVTAIFLWAQTNLLDYVFSLQRDVSTHRPATRWMFFCFFFVPIRFCAKSKTLGGARWLSG